MDDAEPRAWVANERFQVDGLVHGFCSLVSEEWGGDRERARGAMAQRLAPHGRVYGLHQVHGALIAQAPWSAPPDADGAIVVEPGQIAMVETADCMPVLLVDLVAHVAAAVHAGWRGTALRIVSGAVRALVERGAERGRIRALLGPAIGVCCYAVGPELRDHFGSEEQICFEGEHPHLNLRAANVVQLHLVGLDPARVYHVDECTACRADRYPSYRRDGPGCGRLFSFVGWQR